MSPSSLGMHPPPQMRFVLRSLPRDCSNEEVIAEIRRVDSVVGKPKLTTGDYAEHARISRDAVRRRFGGWKQALDASGLSHKYSGRTVTEKMRRGSKDLTDDEVLCELRRVASELGKDFLTYPDVDKGSRIISASTVRRRFGSWHSGLERAGLKLSEMSHRRYSDEQYFENILRAWVHHGRQPTYAEMRQSPSSISPEAYANHFGTWRRALEAFVRRMSQREPKLSAQEVQQRAATPVPATVRPPSVPDEDRRQIPLGLRFKVLSRDRFKCVRCGAAPANDPGCELHVDHMLPLSRGGKTTFDNLQSLCAKCNLGKGNRFCE